jgi:hypothetical protein
MTSLFAREEIDEEVLPARDRAFPISYNTVSLAVACDSDRAFTWAFVIPPHAGVHFVLEVFQVNGELVIDGGAKGGQHLFESLVVFDAHGEHVGERIDGFLKLYTPLGHEDADQILIVAVRLLLLR